MPTIRTNLRLNASTQYTNFPFNSYCVFQGQVLAAGASGIMKCGCGAADNGADIDSYFVPVKTKFGSGKRKRPRKAYLSGKFDGQVSLTMTGDDKTTIGPYLLTPKGDEGAQRRRFEDIGRGLEMVYCSVKVSSVDGSRFSVDTLELAMDEMKSGRK